MANALDNGEVSQYDAAAARNIAFTAIHLKRFG